MMKGIDHIGVAVKDLDEAIKLFKETFNLTSSKIHELKERNMRIALMAAGELEIFELMQPTAPDVPIAKFIAWVCLWCYILIALYHFYLYLVVGCPA